MPQLTTQSVVNPVQISTLLARHLNLDELEALCFELDFEYEELGEGGRTTKAIRLVKHFERSNEILNLAETLLQVRPFLTWEELGREAVTDANQMPGNAPYKGMAFFDVADAEEFYGRDTLIAELIANMQQHQFLAVIGASGSGKSSIVRAGLIPTLRGRKTISAEITLPDGSQNWPVHILTPTEDPLLSLAFSLADSTDEALHLRDKLANQPDWLQLTAQFVCRKKQVDRLFIFVDQFEELFTQCKDEAARQAFIDNLIMATAGPAVVLIALRADFYAQCARYDNLRELLSHQQLYIGPMNHHELREAIQRPAERYGWKFESGLVELMLEDAGATETRSPEPGALPLLSHALLETWQRREGATMTLAGYVSSGGIRGAIAQTAENVYQQHLYPEQRDIARRIFLRLADIGEDTPDTRRRATFPELLSQKQDEPIVEAVLLILTDARLVVVDIAEGNEEKIVQVTHEALIREWPQLRSWLNESREELRLHRRITADTMNWLQLDRDPGALYRGARLAQAAEWAQNNNDLLSHVEREFIDSSQNALLAEEQAKEEARQRELKMAQNLAAEQQRVAEEQKRRAEEQAQAAAQLRRRAVFLAGLIVVALILAAAATLLGLRSSRNASEAASQRETAVFNADIAATNEAQASTNASEAANQRATAVFNADIAATNEAQAMANEAIAVTRQIEADNARREAEQQQQVGLAQSLAALSAVVLDQQNDTELAALLAIEAAHVNSRAEGNVEWLIDSSLRSLLSEPIYFNHTLKGHENVVWSVAASPDGRWLASGGDDQTIRLWQIDQPAVEPVVIREHGGSVASLAFSPDGRLLASAGANGLIRLWDMSQMVNGSPPLLATLPGHEDWVWSVRFSPDGQWLASGSLDGTIRLWDVNENAAELQQAAIILVDEENNAGQIWAVAFSPDSRWLASGSQDGAIRLWAVDQESDTGQPVALMTGHQGNVLSVAFSPDGRWLASSSSDSTVRLWDVAQPAAESLPAVTVFEGHEGNIWSVAFSPQGQQLASSGADQTIRLWDVSQPSAAPQSPIASLQGHRGSVATVTFSSDGTQLISSSEDRTIRLWEISATTAGTATGQINLLAEETVRSVAFSPNGQWMALGTEDSVIQLRNTDRLTDEPITLQGHESQVYSVAFSPDGQLLATVGGDRTVRLWNVSQPAAGTNSAIAVLRGHEGIIWSVAISPDGRWLASAGHDSTIRLWSLTQLEADPILLQGHSGDIWSLSFSPDGRWLASAGGDSTIRLWEMNQLEAEPIVLREHTLEVRSVAFSPDGQWLASSSNDLTVRLWNMAQLDNPPIILPGHEGRIFSVAFSPDGQWLASASADRTVRLWDVSQPEAAAQSESAVLQGHGREVRTVTFSPDGRYIVSGSEDHTTRFWPFLDELIELGCQKVSRNLSWPEWQLYLPGESYRQTCPELPGDPNVPSS